MRAFELRVADRRRAHVDAAPPLAEVEPGADHRDRLASGAGARCRSRRRRLLPARLEAALRVGGASSVDRRASPASCARSHRRARPGSACRPAGSAADARWWADSACTENERSMISIGLPSRPAMLTSAPSTSTCTRRPPSHVRAHAGPRVDDLVRRGRERRHVDLAVVVAGVREHARRPSAARARRRRRPRSAPWR